LLVAFDAGGGLAHLLDGRQQQADQDGDDRDHHQKFDQGEGPAAGRAGYIGYPRTGKNRRRH